MNLVCVRSSKCRSSISPCFAVRIEPHGSGPHRIRPCGRVDSARLAFNARGPRNLVWSPGSCPTRSCSPQRLRQRVSWQRSRRPHYRPATTYEMVNAASSSSAAIKLENEESPVRPRLPRLRKRSRPSLRSAPPNFRRANENENPKARTA
jgi:hypothetical protein